MTSFAGRRVLVVGLGVSGEAAARALLDHGAVVRVTDSSESDVVAARARALTRRGAEVEIGGHDLVGIDADWAVVSPGIPPDAPAPAALRAAGIPVWSEIELASRLASCDFIAVTGTNGKTTTTSLLATMLERGGRATAAAGNIGYPLVDAVRVLGPGAVIAAEVSSFQLEGIETFRPRVAIVLNVSEDHTDWHGSFAAYVAAKARIVENQKPEDAVVVNADDARAVAIGDDAASRVIPFSAASVPAGGAGVADGGLYFAGRRFAAAAEVSLPGVPGLEDALAASAAALDYGVGEDAVAAALRDFRPLAHRLEVVASAGDVRFIDDSKATNPHATLSALRGMQDVVLIAGGRSKGIDLSVLTRSVPPVRAVVAIGEAAADLYRIFEGVVPVDVCDSMEDAVRTAMRHAAPGGSVLLSPACASLDMYESYAARGDDFRRAVGELLAEGLGDGANGKDGHERAK